MKKSIFMLAVTMFIAGAMLTGCQSSADKVQDAKDNVVTANQALDKAVKDSIQQFKKESQEKINDYDKSIADFKAGLANTKKVDKAKYEKALADLEQKKSDLKKKLEEFKEDQVANWKSFKIEFNHDMDDLGKSLKDYTVKNR